MLTFLQNVEMMRDHDSITACCTKGIMPLEIRAPF